MSAKNMSIVQVGEWLGKHWYVSIKLKSYVKYKNIEPVLWNYFYMLILGKEIGKQWV